MSLNSNGVDFSEPCASPKLPLFISIGIIHDFACPSRNFHALVGSVWTLPFNFPGNFNLVFNCASRCLLCVSYNAFY